MSSAYSRSGRVLRRDMRHIFERLSRCSVGVRTSDSIGTGIVLCLNPTVILTARHVIEPGGDITVQTLKLDWAHGRIRPSRHECPAELIADFPLRDVAVLLVENELPQLEAAVIAPAYRPHIGDPFYRLGLDRMQLSAGYLIGDGLNNSQRRRLTVSMIADCGGSGGPLASRSGVVVGMLLESEDDEELPSAAFGLHIRLVLNAAKSDPRIAALIRGRLNIE